MRKAFATNLKILRTAKGLSQQQLADTIGVTRSSIGSYEEGRAEPKLDCLKEIAQFFGIPVDDLLKENVMEKGRGPVLANKIFASNLLFLRESKGMIPKDVAYSIDVELSTYRQWEKGKSAPNYDWLVKLSRFHDVLIDDLVTKYLISK